VIAAASATRKATSAVASLIIASPSTSTPTRSGTPRRLKVAVAATGSVGATTAPSTNAAGQLMPSTAAWATTATATIVMSTTPTARNDSVPSSARRSRGLE
jgi:hypothetical protein